MPLLPSSFILDVLVVDRSDIKTSTARGQFVSYPITVHGMLQPPPTTALAANCWGGPSDDCFAPVATVAAVNKATDDSWCWCCTTTQSLRPLLQLLLPTAVSLAFKLIWLLFAIPPLCYATIASYCCFCCPCRCGIIHWKLDDCCCCAAIRLDCPHSRSHKQLIDSLFSWSQNIIVTPTALLSFSSSCYCHSSGCCFVVVVSIVVLSSLLSALFCRRRRRCCFVVFIVFAVVIVV